MIMVDDNGKKADSNAWQDAFDIVGEFYDTKQAKDAYVSYQALAKDHDLYLYPGLNLREAAFKCKFKLQLFDSKRDKEFPYMCKMYCGEQGARNWLKIAAGGGSVAVICEYIMWRIKQELPHLAVCKVHIQCYPDGHPNLRAGVEVYFDKEGLENMYVILRSTDLAW